MAEVKISTVTKTVQVETEEEVISLQLSQEEARTLAVVLARIGGLPYSPRGHLRSLEYGLNETLGSYRDHPENKYVSHEHDLIYFEADPKEKEFDF